MFRQQNQVNVGGKVYTITKQIGQGAQGAVYKGHSQQGEEVAIKYQNSMNDNEYQVLQSLQQNPKAYIIGIKGVQREINGNTVIVMELADNEFYKYMTENPEYHTLSKDQRNQIFYQMVQAVKELHELGYFHRNLKPESFLVFKKDANGYVKTKLSNLGLCKQQQNQMRHTRNVGTPYYMAPEIFDGFLLYNHLVDSWALGCIWFELMTTQSFLQGNDPNSIFQNIRNATQQYIDQRIDSQQVFNQQEKQLLKCLIKKNANQRIQVKELIQILQTNQNNNQINPNFFNNQNVNVFQTPIKQFPYFQNQPNNFNIIQQNPNYIQPIQQQQYNQNQMSDWKQKQQQQMQQEYEQKLKVEFEQLKQIEIERIKKEEEEKQKQKLLEQQQMLEQQSEIKWKQMEEELRMKNEEEQRKIELDLQKLRELQIEQELKIQFQLEEQKKRNEKEIKRKEEEIQKLNEERLKKELKLKEEELQRQIAQQLQQEYLIKYNQELQQKQQQQRQEMEKVFSETKNKVKKLIKNNKETIEKFILSLEEKSQEKLISESQNIVPQKYKEFQEMTQNFVNQFKQQITKIEEMEKAIQQIDDLEYLSQIQELQKQLFESNQKITQDQINALNQITQQYNELILQLTSQKQLKESLENQKKQQINQLQQLQTQVENIFQTLKVQTNKKFQQFQDFVLSFELCYQEYNKAQEILNQELIRLETQGSSFLIQQNAKGIQQLVTQMGSQLKLLESSLSQLQYNFNQNMMIQCQHLIQDLNSKQKEFSNLDTKIIQLNQQLGRIKNQLNQIIKLKEENQKQLLQWDQQSEALLKQFQNFSNVSGVIQQQIKCKESFDSLKNEFQSELEKLFIKIRE